MADYFICLIQTNFKVLYHFWKKFQSQTDKKLLSKVCKRQLNSSLVYDRPEEQKRFRNNYSNFTFKRVRRILSEYRSRQ